MIPKPASLGKSFWSKVTFDEKGLLSVTVQHHETMHILMQAWMNKEALERTIQTGDVTYWSRSRRQLWRKGEQSGQTQRLISLHIDCDGDALLLGIEQKGVACHTGHRSCFYQKWQGDAWQEEEPPLIDPRELYKNDASE